MKKHITSFILAGLALASPLQAGVVWLASENGTGLTLVTSGSIDITGASDFKSAQDPALQTLNTSTLAYSHGFFRRASAGVATPLTGLASITAQTPTGHTFGHADGRVFWDSAFGASPAIITPVTSLTFDGLTIASVFGTSLDSGPVTVWTHSGTNDTISIARANPIPEPSSTALFGLGGVVLLFRRR